MLKSLGTKNQIEVKIQKLLESISFYRIFILNKSFYNSIINFGCYSINDM